MPVFRGHPVRLDHLGFSLYDGAAGLMDSPHRHNDIEITLLKEGWIDYWFAGTRIRVPGGHLCVRWASIPHQSVALDCPSVHYSLKVPFAWFMNWRMPTELVDAILAGHMLMDCESSEGCSDQAMFRRWSEILRIPGAEPNRIVALEAEARLRRLGLRLSAQKPSKTVQVSAAADLGAVERMTVFIAENFTRPISMALIAKAGGLHPNSAMRLFRKSCGMTLLHYLNLHRIWHAQWLLNTESLKLSEVAVRCGFGSAARFYATFQRVTGETPGAYQASLGGGVAGWGR